MEKIRIQKFQKLYKWTLDTETKSFKLFTVNEELKEKKIISLQR